MFPFRGGAPGARASRRISSGDWLIGIGFIAAFALYSMQFVYFFVDDEAIPFVYAQNVLQGDGLVYNPDDGPVEAYSDFLSIWIDIGILAAVNTLGVSSAALQPQAP
jgi:hypothetical protein